MGFTVKSPVMMSPPAGIPVLMSSDFVSKGREYRKNEHRNIPTH